MTITTRAPARTAARALAVVRLTRPWFWPLGWAGALFGWVLATGRWLPAPGTRLTAVAVGVVLGPLVWGAVCAVNDRHDLAGDRRSPRKAGAPLVTGVLDAADLVAWQRRFAVAALVVAVPVGPAFVAGTAAVLALGWLYSAPPLRLKGRPGFDVAANAVVVGACGPLAGWAAHRPIGDYPQVLVALGVLLAAALYLPTTVLDRAADAAAGDVTAAVRWGADACHRAGVALWTAATGLWLACCHLDVLLVRDGWWFQDVAAVPLVAAYALLARRPTIPRLAGVAVAFGVPATDFLLAYAPIT